MATQRASGMPQARRTPMNALGKMNTSACEDEDSLADNDVVVDEYSGALSGDINDGTHCRDGMCAVRH
eukprot:9110815-Ditylum_brightwellii.AAC.1